MYGRIRVLKKTIKITVITNVTVSNRTLSLPKFSRRISGHMSLALLVINLTIYKRIPQRKDFSIVKKSNPTCTAKDILSSFEKIPLRKINV